MIEPNTYRHRLPEIQQYFRLGLEADARIEKLPGHLTQVTGIPILVCYQFVADAYGEMPELMRLWNECRRFYGEHYSQNMSLFVKP